MTVYQQTASEYLAAWDAGETVFTIDTSGNGPEFEEPVQVLAKEVLRAWLQAEEHTMGTYTRAFDLVRKALADQMPPMSKMQLHHARWIGWKIASRGPAEILTELEEKGEGHRVMAIRPPKHTKNAMAEAVESITRRKH